VELRYDFASDNTAGLCPEALTALSQASEGCCPSYGDDAYTARATDMIREIFETDCDVYFVFNGTAANSLALASMCRSYHSVVCHETSHIETDECGAPEFFSNGTKILLTSGPDGKLECSDIEKMILKRTDIHYPKPQVVSLTQPTELGCLYSTEEIREIAGLARFHGLRVHMDGARFANAAAAFGVSPAELTWRAGVDVLCFGGIKPGISLSEAVVFFDRELSEEFDYRCKQGGQLASKMRFSSAPWVACLQNGVWLRYAENANRTARLLADRLKEIPGVEIARPVAANAVFAVLSPEVKTRLQKAGWRYYEFIGGAARLMTSWHTSDEDVFALVASAACRTSNEAEV
jgi:threonine aldolase